MLDSEPRIGLSTTTYHDEAIPHQVMRINVRK